MHRFSSWTLIGLLGATAGTAALLNACSSPPATGGAGAGATTGTSSSGKGGASSSSSGGQGGCLFNCGSGGSTSSSGGQGGGNGCTPGAMTDDKDMDGYTPATGDCNDCDANVNPGAVDTPAMTVDGGMVKAADNDCDGTITTDVVCDSALAEDTMDAMDGAKAIGLCDTRFVVGATWVQADGSPPPAAGPASPPATGDKLANFHLGHGIIDSIGANLNPQQGTKMLEVSSGTARKPGEASYVHRNFDKGYTGAAPVGFPKESPSCPGAVTGAVHDSTGLELSLKAPTNVKGFTFDFTFFTFEWPQYICKQFNDFFIANMVPFPKMQTDGNISFDPQGNPISVNNAFLDICGCPGNPPADCAVPPAAPVKNFKCSLGAMGVAGTDWSSDAPTNPAWTNGSTGWLQTQAPIVGGTTFTLRFVTYDSADGNVDSSTFVDNFQWSAEAGTVQTIIPPPK